MTVLSALVGALIVGGVVLVAAGLRPVVATPSRAGTLRPLLVRGGRLGRRWGRQLAVGVGLGVVLAVITGLPLFVLLGPVAAVGLPILLSAPANREIDILQALDRWVRTMTATLTTGRSITDAIRWSVRQAPALLGEPLQLLVLRLDDRWSPRQALHAFADDLDSADADAVIAALALAAERGGTGATATLTALADSIQDRLRAAREVEAERAKPRQVVRQVTMITATVLCAAFVFGREFFAPYGTSLGQVILAALLGTYVASLVVLRRLTLPRRRDRILGGAG